MNQPSLFGTRGPGSLRKDNRAAVSALFAEKRAQDKALDAAATGPTQAQSCAICGRWRHNGLCGTDQMKPIPAADPNIREADKPRVQTQSELILAALRAGERLTGADAFRRWGCTRWSGRVYDLRQAGHAIEQAYCPVKGCDEFWMVEQRKAG